jgi:RHS repeat-associated protein
MDYLPFGELLSGGSGTTHKFTGKERDTESGLDNFGARYFSSLMGRFSSSDPMILMDQKLMDPQQWNMYSYTRNDPMRFLDPTGMYTIDCGQGVKNCEKEKQKFEDSLVSARKEKGKVGAAANAYGAKDDPNGVHVTLVKTVDAKHPDVNGNTTSQKDTGGLHFDENTKQFQQRTQVDIQAGQSNDELEADAVHEGSHVEDRANYVASLTLDPASFATGANAALNILAKQSEENAIGTENILRRSKGMPQKDFQSEMLKPAYKDNPGLNRPLFPAMPSTHQ